MRIVFFTLLIFESLFGYSQTGVQFEWQKVPIGYNPVIATENATVSILPLSGKWYLNIQKEESLTFELEISENIMPVDLIGRSSSIDFYYQQLNGETWEVFRRTISLNDGKSTNSELIISFPNSGIKRKRNKAKVIANNLDLIRSSSTDNYPVPIEHWVKTKVSENGKSTLIYRYDHSSDDLLVDFVVVKENGENEKGKLKMDEGDLIYDFGVNDNGDLFIANIDDVGDIEVLKFKKGSDDFELLNINAGNSTRDDIQIIVKGDKVYLACKTEIEERFYGALYAVMNFETGEVERIHFEQITPEIEDEIDSLSRAGKTVVTDKTKFALSQFKVLNDEEILLCYEYFDYQRSGFVLKDIQDLATLEWQEHKVKVKTGPLLVYSFDKLDELRWSRYLFNSNTWIDKKFISASSVTIGFPENEEIWFYLKGSEKSAVYRMDYIYNSWNKTVGLSTKDQLIPNWSFSDDSKHYKVFYKEDLKKLIIE